MSLHSSCYAPADFCRKTWGQSVEDLDARCDVLDILMLWAAKEDNRIVAHQFFEEKKNALDKIEFMVYKCEDWATDAAPDYY